MKSIVLDASFVHERCKQKSTKSFRRKYKHWATTLAMKSGSKPLWSAIHECCVFKNKIMHKRIRPFGILALIARKLTCKNALSSMMMHSVMLVRHTPSIADLQKSTWFHYVIEYSDIITFSSASMIRICPISGLKKVPSECHWVKVVENPTMSQTAVGQCFVNMTELLPVLLTST